MDPRDQQHMPPGEFNVKECYFYEGAVPNGVTAHLDCPPGITGRYLVVQLQDTNSLILCEVTAAAGWYQPKMFAKVSQLERNEQVITFSVEI